MNKCFLIFFITASGCRTNYDPTTPEGSHNLFIRAFTGHDYGEVYPLLMQETRAAFLEYVKNTKSVVALIRSQYPEEARAGAIDNLSIPFKKGSFTYEEIESAQSNEEIFTRLCQKMFDGNQNVSMMQEYGTKIDKIEFETPGQAVIYTLAEEKLVYKLESDGIWRTDDIFGRNFVELAKVSRKNLEITQANVVLFDK